MPNVYAGASGWAYSSWKPDFYPAKLASAKFLSYYATRLNSVEVNYTFRSFPNDKLLRRWSDATPAGFKFAIKAHQSITHVKRLRGAGESTAKFLISLEHLKKEGKLGPVLFQLPPHLNCDVSLLMEFLAELPRHLRAAIEFRDTSWFTEDSVRGASQEKRRVVPRRKRRDSNATGPDRGLFLPSPTEGRVLCQESSRTDSKGHRSPPARRGLCLFQTRRNAESCVPW